MLRLMKKFAFWYILYPGLLLVFGLPLFNHDRLTGPDPLSLSFATYLAPMIWLVLGAMWSHEQAESKTNGYAFLRILPIETARIVKAKFALVFVAVAIYVTGCSVAFAFVSTAPDYLVPSCAYVIVHGDICLVLAGLLYLGIFSFGFSRFGKYVLITWVLLLVTPVPFRILFLKPRGITDSDIMQFLRGPYWIIGTLICLSVYAILMKPAAKKLYKRDT